MRPRLTKASGALLRAVRTRLSAFDAGEKRSKLVLAESVSTPWASITFSGEQHRFALRFPDLASACIAGLLLHDADLTLDAQLLVELELTAIHSDEDIFVEFEALTIEE